jgi:L-arabinose isomerase
MSDLGDRFRFVANEIDVVPPDAPLPALPVARAVWEPRPDLSTSAECWLTAGGPHHTVLSLALTSEHLWDLAEMTRTELALIDASTTPRTFIRELRWNQAYHRLALGF